MRKVPLSLILMLAVSFTSCEKDNNDTGSNGIANNDTQLPPGPPSFDTHQENPFGLKSVTSETLTFVDIDNDGDLDVFGSYNQTVSDAGTVYIQRNNGSADNPQFGPVERKPFGLNSKSLGSIKFADLDNDGDFDAIGSSIFTADVYIQINNGNAQNPNFGALESQALGLTQASLTPPTFVDIDNDGDLDAIGTVAAGVSTSGFVYFQENTGSPSNPAFGTAQQVPFGLNVASLGTPFLTDIDNDGDLDAFGVSGFDMNIPTFFQENQGTVSNPQFGTSQENPFGLNKSLTSHSFVDIDNDLDLDAFGVSTTNPPQVYYQKNTVR